MDVDPELHILNVEGSSIAVMLPADNAMPRSVLYCMPGGGMSKKYFDLGGAQKPDYSFSRYFAEQGFLVISIDPIGVGDSTRPDDSYALIPDKIVEHYQATINTLREKIMNGDLLKALAAFSPDKEFGVGHSMGAMLTTLAQANHSQFDGLVLLGFGTKGLPQILSDEEKEVVGDRELILKKLPEFAAKRFYNTQYPRIPDAHHEESEASEVLKEAADVVLPLPAALSMFPGNIAQETATIKCPVFLSVGDRDIAGPPLDLPDEYTNSEEMTLYVQEDCGHHGFVAKSRASLLNEIYSWLEEQLERSNG